MTADIINLKQIRKRKAEVERRKIAARRRALFGRPSREREGSKAETIRQSRELDAHQLDD
jgi:hypothetical protein